MLGSAYVLLAWITIEAMSQVRKSGSGWNSLSYLMLLLPQYFILSLTGSYLHKSLQKAALSITLVSVLFFFMAIVEAGRREPFRATVVAVLPFLFLILLTAGSAAWLYYRSNDLSWKWILFRYLPCIPVLMALIFLAADGLHTWPVTRHGIIYGSLCFNLLFWTLYALVNYKNSLRDLRPKTQKCIIILRCLAFIAFFLSIAVFGLKMSIDFKTIIDQAIEIALLMPRENLLFETYVRMGFIVFLLNIVSAFLVFLMERNNLIQINKEHGPHESREVESGNA